MKTLLLWAIKTYQGMIRLFPVNPCRFYPSCSTYACQAIEQYGPAKGLFMAVKRIFRCSPLSPGGYDPVK